MSDNLRPMTSNDQIDLVSLLHRIDIKVTRIESKIQTIENNYVTRQEFVPIQRLVYGLISIVMVSFIGSIVALVWKKGA